MDILTIGHTTVDLYKRIKKTPDVSEEDSNMCFNHGSKILVEELNISPGGNALNVSVGTSRLGIKTAIYTELGDDEFTKTILNKLKRNSVNTNFCFRNRNTKNNMSTIIIYHDDRTIFSYHHPQKYSIQKWKTPEIVYYTSMPKGYENFHEDLINHIEKNPTTMLAFNPGSVQLKGGIKTFEDILNITDVLFVNKEEAVKLTKEGSLKELHEWLQELGPKLTVITDGKRGASAAAIGTLHKIETYSDERPLLDKTGAGDAFSSGFLSAIFYKKNLEEALLWGAINSGSVIKEVGATKGLLSKRQMNSIAKEILS